MRINIVPVIGDKLNGFTVTEVKRVGSTIKVFGVKGDLDEKVIDGLKQHFALPKAEQAKKFFFRPGSCIGTLERA
jgi:hypothetical protein